MDKPIYDQLRSSAKDCIKLDNVQTTQERLKIVVRATCLIVIARSNSNLNIDPKISHILLNHIGDLLYKAKLNIHLKEFLLCAKHIVGEMQDIERYSFTNYINLVVAANKLVNPNGNPQNIFDENKYPGIIHIETQSICNAKCNFCDYKSLDRIGTVMSDELIEKVLSDLSQIPKTNKFIIQPYKISEPFLDRRLPSLIKKFLLFHEGSNVQIISNGSYIPDDSLTQILSYLNKDYVWRSTSDSSKISRLSLVFSLNEVQKDKYEKLMKLSFEKTVKNLKNIHQTLESTGYRIPIYLSRVSTSAKGDRNFTEFCEKEFPLFKNGLLKLNNWSSTNTYSTNHQQLSYEPLQAFKVLPCKRWHDLSIMSNGEVALCCMDSGIAKLNLGNVKTHDCLELYRRKYEKFIPPDNKRGSSSHPCNSCTYQQRDELVLQLNNLVNVCEQKHSNFFLLGKSN